MTTTNNKRWTGTLSAGQIVALPSGNLATVRTVRGRVVRVWRILTQAELATHDPRPSDGTLSFDLTAIMIPSDGDSDRYEKRTRGLWSA